MEYKYEVRDKAGTPLLGADDEGGLLLALQTFWHEGGARSFPVTILQAHAESYRFYARASVTAHWTLQVEYPQWREQT